MGWNEHNSRTQMFKAASYSSTNAGIFPQKVVSIFCDAERRSSKQSKRSSKYEKIRTRRGKGNPMGLNCWASWYWRLMKMHPSRVRMHISICNLWSTSAKLSILRATTQYPHCWHGQWCCWVHIRNGKIVLVLKFLRFVGTSPQMRTPLASSKL